MPVGRPHPGAERQSIEETEVPGPDDKRGDGLAEALPYSWAASVTLLRSAVVIRQVFTALAVGVGIVWLLMIALTGADGDLDAAGFWALTRVFLIILGGLLVLTLLVMAIFYRRYEYRFTLDEQGVSASTVGQTRRKNAFVNALLVLSGRPSAMGAGVLAGSRQDQHVSWKELDGFRVAARHPSIALTRGRRTIMLIQCTEENCQAVSRFVRDHVRSKGYEQCGRRTESTWWDRLTRR